jgi:hypothetical protein
MKTCSKGASGSVLPTRAGNLLATMVGAAVVLLATAPDGSAGTAVDAPNTNATPVPQLLVRVDPRVELFSLLFRLAGNPEYSQGKVASYNADVDKHFAAHRDHAVVKLARQLRQTRGVSYDACMSLAVHVNNADELQLLVPLQPWPEGLDQRWTAASVSNFLAATRQFVKAASFQEFTQQHQALYTNTTARLETLLKDAHLDWFHNYFGERPQANFIATAGLLNGGSCYGSRSQDATGREQLYCILGVWKIDQDGLPEFDREMLSTVVHEFCHSYANVIVDRHQDELSAAGAKLYRAVAQQMRSQAYGNSQTMLRESLVRACTVRYQRQYLGDGAAQTEIGHHKSRSFLWTGELSDRLAEYEAQRERYPTLESFAPRLVAFFNEYADKFENEQSALARKRPKVVSMIPANGATDVDPGLTEIRVRFDRPMQDGSWSLVGGGPNCPETTGRPYYDSKRTTWTVPVRLQPGWDYEFHMNRGEYDSFRSKEGVPLESVHVTFSTGKAAQTKPKE